MRITAATVTFTFHALVLLSRRPAWPLLAAAQAAGRTPTRHVQAVATALVRGAGSDACYTMAVADMAQVDLVTRKCIDIVDENVCAGPICMPVKICGYTSGGE